MRTSLCAFVFTQADVLLKDNPAIARTLAYVERRRTSETIPWNPTPRNQSNVTLFKRPS
jgi:hypothetical protein